ncbi:MAG: anthranilate synthase component [Thermoproteota archaeon]|nr:anthranilate synthase component [Thermoproteota archaeon]
MEGNSINEDVTSPFQAIKKIFTEHYLPYKGLRFVGGAVGYISYDTVRYWEKLPEKSFDDSNFPDIELGMYDDGIVFDHRNKEAFYYYYTKDRFTEIKELMKNRVDHSTTNHTEPKPNITQEDFEDAILKAKDYITTGDILQVVLSKRFDFTMKGDMTTFYESLRRINPSPYMYFLKMDKRQIIGSSPEMLVRLEGKTVETFPIAGTRPHVSNSRKNQALTKELLEDPKERAEHTMLLDLARNDIGKVSEFESVSVPQFMRVQQYSHVQHIVSRVVGRLRADCDSFDSLEAVFPAGTVSGAPKVRAMEIIEELEPMRRGPYAGAVGYFSYNGNSDFAITIRTLVLDGKKAHIQVGAGIVADSVPENEWIETDHKAQALIRALEDSGERKT